MGLPNVLAQDKQEMLPLANGDRVVVVVGPERGKIGVIEEVTESTQAARIRGINEVCLFQHATYRN
jgi:ribosomal protein L24